MNTSDGIRREEIRTTDGIGRSEDNDETNALANVGESTLFLKLREQSIRQVTEMMDSTIASMRRLEKSMDRVVSSTSGVVSAARIWSSFYDPMVVEKLKEESVKEKGFAGAGDATTAAKNVNSNQARCLSDSDV